MSTRKTPEDLSDLFFQLFLEIGIIDQLASTAFEGVLPFGLTRAQFSVLNHFMRLGDRKTPAELASAFQVTRGTMTSTLQKLEKKGFVEITPDETDGRSKRILMTSAGREAHRTALITAAPALIQISQALSADDVDRILPTLQKLRLWLDSNRTLQS